MARVTSSSWMRDVGLPTFAAKEPSTTPLRMVCIAERLLLYRPEQRNICIFQPHSLAAPLHSFSAVRYVCALVPHSHFVSDASVTQSPS